MSDDLVVLDLESDEPVTTEEGDEDDDIRDHLSLAYLREVVAILDARERSLLPFGAHRGEWKKVKKSLKRFRALLSLAEQDHRDEKAWWDEMTPEMRRMWFTVVEGGKP